MWYKLIFLVYGWQGTVFSHTPDWIKYSPINDSCHLYLMNLHPTISNKIQLVWQILWIFRIQGVFHPIISSWEYICENYQTNLVSFQISYNRMIYQYWKNTWFIALKIPNLFSSCFNVKTSLNLFQYKPRQRYRCEIIVALTFVITYVL